MWNQSRLMGPLNIPKTRDSAGNVIAWHDGYHVLIGDAALLTDATTPYKADYSEYPVVFAGVPPMVLTFADEAEARAKMGDQWVELENGTDTTPPVPLSVTNRQLRLALLQEGHMDAVNAMVATLDASAKTQFEYANDFYRDNPLIVGAAKGLGMTTSDMDNLFRLAATL